MTSERREIEAAALFGSHGLADALTTAAAAVTTPTAAEANPLMRAMLAEGIGFAVGAMLLVVGMVAAAWPRLAEWADFPRCFAPGLALVGVLVALGNLAVVMLP